MRYAKRSRSRKSGRRGNRTLSTRRIFSNKSAKAQASQIYSLRRAINRVKRSCAPEVKVYDTPVDIREFTATYEDITSASKTNMRLSMPNFTQGTSDWQRIGDKVRLLPLTWFVNGIYRKVTKSSSGIPMYNLLNAEGCAMRIVAVQSKTSSATLPTYDDIFSTFEESASTTLTMTNLNSPFKTGITTKFSVLYNRVFYFNENSPIKNLKVKLYPKIKHLRWETGVEYPRGNITVFVMFGGLQTTGQDLNNADHNKVELTHWMKVPFTDA